MVADAETVQETASLILGERSSWGEQALRDATPFLLEFFLPDAPPDSRLRLIYESLFLIIAVDDHVSVPQATALTRLAEARLQLGSDLPTYKETVDQVASAFERIDSPAAAHGALEAADMLVGVPCPVHVARQAFLARVASLFQRWYRRIDAAQWALLGQLGAELGVPGLASVRTADGEEFDEGPAWARLNGKSVALYSLREPVLRRSEAVLRVVAPGVRVELFHDKVGGSTSLRTAAASADLFVIATAAAKHAATLFIEAKRPDSKPTAYARGQGSASMLEAVRESLWRLAE